MCDERTHHVVFKGGMHGMGSDRGGSTGGGRERCLDRERERDIDTVSQRELERDIETHTESARMYQSFL